MSAQRKSPHNLRLRRVVMLVVFLFTIILCDFLRTSSLLLPKESPAFSYEYSEIQENFFWQVNPVTGQTREQEYERPLSQREQQISDLLMIPSTKEVIEIENMTEEEHREQNEKYSHFKRFDEKVQFEEGEDVEDSVRSMLPRFNKGSDVFPNHFGRNGAFDGSYQYSTFLCKLLRYYTTLYKVF